MSEATPQPRYVTVEELIQFLVTRRIVLDARSFLSLASGTDIYAFRADMFRACADALHVLYRARAAYRATAGAMLRGVAPNTEDHKHFAKRLAEIAEAEEAFWTLGEVRSQWTYSSEGS
jgi:hypothetical protein